MRALQGEPIDRELVFRAHTAGALTWTSANAFIALSRWPNATIPGSARPLSERAVASVTAVLARYVDGKIWMNHAVGELFEAADAGSLGTTADERLAAIAAGIADLRDIRDVGGILHSPVGRTARRKLREGAREAITDQRLLSSEWPGLLTDWALTIAANHHATPAEAADVVIQEIGAPKNQ